MKVPAIEWPPKVLRRVPLGFVPPGSSLELTLTEEQRHVASQLPTVHRTLLSGVAGSGKTHLAIAFAKGNAAMGKRVLYLSPRKPLAMWLASELDRHRVSVQTIHQCMKACLDTQPGGAPPRVGFDDRAYFEAATQAADPGRFDLVIVDEWQTVSDLERAFVERLAARSSLVAVEDPTRDLRNASRQTDAGLEVLSLTEGFRAKDGVARLDAIYATEGFDPFPSPLAAATVLVSVLDDPDALEKRVQEAVVALWRRGFAQGEVGVASGLGRDRSALATNLKAPPSGPRTFQLTDAPARTGLACDGFSYWLGLERRAMVLAEFPTSLADRRKRLHIALSRACEEVHLLLPREDIKEDQALSAWLKATRAIR